MINMAMIPEKVKTSKTLDVGGVLEKVLIVLIVLVFADSILAQHVHKTVTPLMYAAVVLITLYLILPNKKNYGTSGYTRMILVLKYWIEKQKERRAGS